MDRVLRKRIEALEVEVEFWGLYLEVGVSEERRMLVKEIVESLCRQMGVLSAMIDLYLEE